MSAADYDEIMNTPHKAKLTSQQSRYFVRYTEQPNAKYGDYETCTHYDFIDCEYFEQWLKEKEDRYIGFDLLIVNKM